MDLNRVLLELYTQRAKLIAAIEQLETLAGSRHVPPSTRGRKSMGEAERREVSERMKKYWSSRREARGAAC